MKKILGFILVLFVFVYSFWATSWTASYIAYETNWRSHLVFTPKQITDPGQIYAVDKLIYAVKYDPTMSFLFVLSFLVMIGFIIYWFQSLLERKREGISN